MIEQITAKPSQKRKLFAMLDVLWTNECYRLIRSLQGKAYIPTPSQSRFIRNRFRSFGQLPLVSRCTSAPSVVQINFYRGIKFVSSFFLFFFIYSFVRYSISIYLFFCSCSTAGRVPFRFLIHLISGLLDRFFLSFLLISFLRRVLEYPSNWNL